MLGHLVKKKKNFNFSRRNKTKNHYKNELESYCKQKKNV